VPTGCNIAPPDRRRSRREPTFVQPPPAATGRGPLPVGTARPGAARACSVRGPALMLPRCRYRVGERRSPVAPGHRPG
jgi:hypothetical protein